MRSPASEIAVYAQSVHWADEGAFTGEISPPMLLELGVDGAVVGHSERRQFFGETDATVARRARHALDAGLRVIACLGETEEEREAGETETVLRLQAEAIGDATEAHEHLVVAYEPVWAIGTGKTATPEIAQEAHAFIRSILDVPLLYGGSVKPENAAELLSQPDVDGALVGGASLEVDSFTAICETAASALVALVVLDGWGCAPPGPGNAIEQASTPVFDALWERYPHTTLEASGHAVGLPDGQMGNSEVGHLTIGAGRVVYQDLVRIDRAIEDGSLMENEALTGAFRRAKERGGNVHLLGLVSYGGVHSHIDHLRALLDLAWREGMDERTFVHAFTDGRDVSPHAARGDLAELVEERARIVTISGRYYAMDRDGRWERTERALAAITEGGPTADDPLAAIEASYAAGITDEFIEPVVLPGPRLGPGRRRDLLQLPPGPDAAALAEADRARDRPDHDDALPRRLPVPGRVRRAARPRDDGRGARLPRSAPAPRGRDGEVRARHVLLQRRRRAGVGGGDADPRPLAAGCRDLRPEAGDVRGRGGRALRGRDRERLPLRDRQLREPGHGRPYGRDSRRWSRPWRRPTPAWAVSSKRSPNSAASASSRPTTGTPSSSSSPTASARIRRTR